MISQFQNWTKEKRMLAARKRTARIAAMTPEQRSAWTKAWVEKKRQTVLEKYSKLMRPGKFFCSRCNRYKNPECFYAAEMKLLSRRGLCRVCKRKSQNASNARHPETGRSRSERNRKKEPAHARWSTISQNAKKKGRKFISLPEFKEWFVTQKDECVYCGMSQAESMAMFKRSLCIDRKDNSQSYILGNIALACHRCNTVKSCYLTYDQMMIVAKMFFRPKDDLLLVDWYVDKLLDDFVPLT